MATWSDLASASLEAAKLLLDHRMHRSCISRAYYAAYAALTQVLKPHQKSFVFAKNNPSHDQLLKFTVHNLDAKRYGPKRRQQLSSSTRLLQSLRIRADYMPDQPVDHSLALQALRHAALVVRYCGGRS
jgi:uncharacterized protein (UPF0332 family)